MTFNQTYLYQMHIDDYIFLFCAKIVIKFYKYYLFKIIYDIIIV